MEGTQPGQGAGQAPEVVQQIQKPYHKFQQYPGNQVKGFRQIIKVGIVRWGVLHCVHLFLNLPVDGLRRVRGGKADFQYCIRGLRLHFRLDGQRDLDLRAAVYPLAGDEAVDAGILPHAPGVGRQHHMEHTEALEPFTALGTDVFIGGGTVQGVPDEVL